MLPGDTAGRSGRDGGRPGTPETCCERGGDVEECRKTVAYLDARRDRMRYDEYVADGIPIGLGIEAGCKNVVGQRMKCASMRRSVAGANPVLWLRCARLGGWLDDYWDARVAKLAA